MAALLDNEDLLAAALGELARRDRTREAGTDDHRVELGNVDVIEYGILNAHEAPFGLHDATRASRLRGLRGLAADRAGGRSEARAN